MGKQLTRWDVLMALSGCKNEKTVFVATTGKTGRELYEVGDSENYLYMVGSMGCVSTFGLGLAMARPDLRVVVIDGDGACMMRMGAMATVGHYAPENLVHVLLDNQVHDSTGGQKTYSELVDFPSIAFGCGYPVVKQFKDTASLVSAVRESASLSFFYVPILAGSKSPLGRPKVTPAEVKDRLLKFIQR